ncbi:MAG: DUF3592 domain-containing protein [Pseudomonadota bacterium]
MLGAFALFCGLVLLAGWAFLIRDWIASVNWTIVPGTVRGALVEAARESDPFRPWEQKDGYRSVIRYAYTVDDQTYVGSRYSATREPFFETAADADAMIGRFPIGGALRVRVNPKDPKQSLLMRQLSLADALPGYLAMACLLVGVLSI